MTDETANLILAHLRDSRAELSGLPDDMDDVKYRLSSLEQQVAGLRADMVHYSARQDSFELRTRRIERRLELREPD